MRRQYRCERRIRHARWVYGSGICDGKAVSAAASGEVFKSNAVIVEDDFIEDGILVASSEGSKVSSRRKRFEKEDPAILLYGWYGWWKGCQGDGLGNEGRGGNGNQ